MSVLVQLSTTTGIFNDPETPLEEKFKPLPRASDKSGSTDSICWNQAKAHFREKHIHTVSGSQRNELEKNIERFLKNNNRIDETISECKSLQNAADRQYSNKSGSSKFIKKLLDVLVVVKSVGDPLLQCAPESISIAWSAISLLISLGVNDLENCGCISEACTSIATIVLNCRLYENRYQKNEENHGIITAIEQLLSTILDFFWFANKKLRDKKIKRLFKDIFDQKVNETYQEVMTRYKSLREDTELAFEEKVVESLESLQTQLEQEMKKTKSDIIGSLFPPLKDIVFRLEDIADATRDVLTEIQVKDKFDRYRKNLKPTDIHERQLEATIEPLPRGTDHLCKWLFRHQHYQSWERIPSKTRVEKEQGLGLIAADKRPSLIPNEILEVVPSNNVNLLYIKGRAGFGKSVMMATIIRRLQAGMPLSTGDYAPSDRIGNRNAANKNPVLFFFFKRGYDDTQLTSKALSSLVAQLFDDNYAKTKEDKEKFIRAIDSFADSSQSSKKDILVGDRADHEPKEESASAITNKDLLKIEAIARQLGKTVYIAIDGIDECTDFKAEDLVGDLIKLGRSKNAAFKIIMSSREGLDIEGSFAKANDTEAHAKFVAEIDYEADTENKDSFHCITHDDATILTVTKETNSDDMKEYLKYSLRELMKRRAPGISHLGKMDSRRRQSGDKRSRKKLEAKVANMADNIQKKSEGMFTYSAMVITNLGQPSPLSLMERLENLPTGMNELYSRQLDALTKAERKLVLLALKRIAWSPTDMGTVEIAEEFKQVYLRGNESGDKADDDDDDNSSVEGSISGGEEDLEENVDLRLNKENQENVNKSEDLSGTRPLLRRADTYPGENHLERAMRKPEISDTIFHLGNAGRDFFTFSKDKQTIGFIHKSVRDWYEIESKEAAQSDRGVPSIASLFSRDSESGELKLTLPIPLMVMKGQLESEFPSEKDAQLDILIYILQVLVHPRFQELYLPYYEPVQKEGRKNLDQSLDTAKAEPDGDSINQQNPNGDNQPAQNVGSSSGARISNDSEDRGAEDSETTTSENDQELDKKASKDEDASKEQRTIRDENTDNGGESSVDEESSTDGELSTDEESSIETFHEGPWRCEIHHWIHHMRRVGELWSREERKGERWEKLWDLLRKLAESENNRRWQIQFCQYFWGLSLETARPRATNVELMHQAGNSGLEVLMDFLLTEPNAKAHLQTISPSQRMPLNYVAILQFPETINRALQYDVDINVKDIVGNTVLATLLTAVPLNQTPIDYESEQVKDLIKSFKYLLNKGADVNQCLTNGETPLQALIRIGDESLFDLAMDTGKVNVNATDSFQQTALHNVWKSSNLSPQAQVSIARKLLDAGADPNAQDSESKAPLLEAVLSRNFEGVELLLNIEGDNMVNRNDEDNEGQTALIALIVAIYRKQNDDVDTRLIELLIEHKTDINAADKNGWTAFRWAVWLELWDIAKLLIEAHSKAAEPDYFYMIRKDIYGNTILHSAATDKSGVKMAKLIFEVLNQEDARDFLEEKETTNGLTALHQAVTLESLNLNFAFYLIELHARVDATNSQGDSIGDTAFKVWMRLRSQADNIPEITLEEWTKLYLAVSPVDPNNMFLHHAISVGDEEVIRKLAESGMNPLKKDSENWDAFDWAYACNRQSVVRECFPDVEVDYQNRRENWKDTFSPILGWDPDRSHSGLEFQETDKICALPEDSNEFEKAADDVDYRFAVITNHPISPYNPEFYYEVTILNTKEPQKSFLAIGLAGEGIPVNRLPGWPHHTIATYGLHGDDGRIYTPELEIKDEEQFIGVLETGEQPYGVGDTVGCGYDTVNHTVFWTLNGRYLGVGFKGVCHRLYPILATRDWFSASTNFGNDPDQPFKWKGSREVKWSDIPVMVEPCFS